MLVRYKLVLFEWLEIVLLKVWMENIQTTPIYVGQIMLIGIPKSLNGLYRFIISHICFMF